ncbi:MAG: hypothetical protein JWQ38_1579 [Flavipsychrobacter sp.]|nr:hypothetical protein [Flavipsychrobacter sp.]
MQSYLSSFTYLHSILRYFILLFAFIVMIQSLMGMVGKKKFKPINKQSVLVLLIFCDLQLLLGVMLYSMRGYASMFSSGDVMKDPVKRFWAVEHGVGMIIAIALVHIGYSTTKKLMDDDRKFKKIFWCVFSALIIIAATIPWQWRTPGVGRPNIPSVQLMNAS